MSKQDSNGVRTAEDIVRRYDLGSIPVLKKAVKNSELGLNKTNKILEDFVNATVGNLENLQKQIDGSITSWFHNGAPTLENYPASDWVTEEDKAAHAGDLYYDKDTGYAYRFCTTEDDTSYEWLKITDNDVVEALAIANAAQDTADSKRRIFTETPVPPYDNGDLWIRNQEIYVCQITKDKYQIYEDGDFIVATKYTDDTYAIKVGEDLKVLSGTVTTIKEGFDSFEVDITTTVEQLDAELLIAQTSIEANTEAIELKVSKDGVIGAINLSEEEALILATKIQLVGEVTLSSWCSTEDNTYIDGGKIYSKSIKAESLDVDDLFALEATVGGWGIDEDAIYRTFVENVSDTNIYYRTTLADEISFTGSFTEGEDPEAVDQISASIYLDITGKVYKSASNPATLYPGLHMYCEEDIFIRSMNGGIYFMQNNNTIMSIADLATLAGTALGSNTNYVKLGNYVIQWGLISMARSSNTTLSSRVTFPIAFVDSNYTAHITLAYSANAPYLGDVAEALGGLELSYMDVRAFSMNSLFTTANLASYVVNARWVAIGRWQ